jgi:spore maturation protein CgeB
MTFAETQKIVAAITEVETWSASLTRERAKEHTSFLNSGMMVLQNSRWGEITRRIFEGMACGKMVLTDRLSENKKLHELFEDGEDIIYYEGLVDCINKMNYYVSNPMETALIAKSGMKKVLANHTEVNRVDFIIKKWKEHV